MDASRCAIAVHCSPVNAMDEESVGYGNPVLAKACLSIENKEAFKQKEAKAAKMD